MKLSEIKFGRQLFYSAVLGVNLSFLTLFYSCSTLTEESNANNYIDVYYFSGSIDTDLPCEGDMSVFPEHMIDQGEVTISLDEFENIQRLINTMERAGENEWTYFECLQCSIHAGDSVRRVTLGQFGPINVNAKSFQRNDTLVYMLRKHTGFYNHYSARKLETYNEEIQKFGLPDGYRDLSEQPEFKQAFIAKIKLQVE